MTDSLFGKKLPELETICRDGGYPKYTAKQIAQWLYHQHVQDVRQMTNLSQKIREALSQRFGLGINPPSQETVSKDATKKYLFAVEKGFVEAAVIPEEDRATLCLSSQVGCARACAFCFTGRQGLKGNLSVAEILNQYERLPERDQISNIVYMGMGEPLDNEQNVLTSLEILTSPWGYGKSPTRITLSTIGIIDPLKRFLEKSTCHLAVSLHFPFLEERSRWMPATKEYPLADLIALLRQYDFTKQRRLTFEYILFDGVNDSPRHSKELVRLLNPLPCRINLLHFHALPESPLKGSAESVLQRFQSDLQAKGMIATIRKSRGEDIFAACGLLSTKHLSEK